VGAVAIRLAAGVPLLGGEATLGDPPHVTAALTTEAQGRAHTADAPAPDRPGGLEDRDGASAPEAAGPRYTSTAPRGAMDHDRWPAQVSIARLGVTAPVGPVGVGSQGALVVPASPSDVGWYHGGAVPGEPGVALLTSHIDTRTEGRGVFAGLVRLEIGDVVTVLAADGTEQRWTVTARTQHAKEELPDGLFARTGAPTLALVTCGGPFDRAARSYRDNVIVWAELLY
jgi:hypothetical protein